MFRPQGENQPPERPPKPAKYKSTEEFENSVITKTSCANKTDNICDDQVTKLGCEQFAETTKRVAYNQVDNYDVPNMFCSKVDSKVSTSKRMLLQAVFEVSSFRNILHRL